MKRREEARLSRATSSEGRSLASKSSPKHRAVSEIKEP